MRHTDVKTKLKAGLVGAGQVCQWHVAALRRLPFVEIVGLYDIDPAKAESVGAELGVQIKPSLEALRHAGADVIHILTPPHTHAQLATAALDLGCHVYVEKLAAVDVADCRAVENVAAARKLHVCVGHSLLFDPQVMKALNIVRSGKLGRIVSVDIFRSSTYPPYEGGPLPSHCRSAGHPFRDVGVHALYLFEAILGPIEHAQADWKSLGGAPNLAFDEWRAQVRCRDGMGQCHLSWNVRPLQSQMVIAGTKGVLRIDLLATHQALRRVTPLPRLIERVLNAWSDNAGPLVQLPRTVLGLITGQDRKYHGLQSLVGEFYRALRDGAGAPVCISDAKRVVQWTERIARLADQDHNHCVLKHRLSPRVQALVTGATGAVGRAIVARLRDEGKQVRILVRRPPEETMEGVEVAVGDLGDPDAVDRAVRGARVVIHAGSAMRGEWANFQCATVIGTRNIVESCRTNGVRRLVHISTLSVLDWAGHDGAAHPLDEAGPLEPYPERRGYYTRSKLKAERIVLHAARENGLPAVILRPGQVFGCGIPLLTPNVARPAGTHWIVLGDGRQRLPLIHMDDLVDAVCRAADGDIAPGTVIHLLDDVAPTTNEVLTAVLGPDAHVRRLPRRLVLAAAAIATAGLKLLRRPSRVTPYRLRSAMSRVRFTSANAHLLEGWRPIMGFRAGVNRAVGARPLARAVPADELLVPHGGELLDGSTSPRA